MTKTVIDEVIEDKREFKFKRYLNPSRQSAIYFSLGFAIIVSFFIVGVEQIDNSED